jgi:hypothetical protein
MIRELCADEILRDLDDAKKQIEQARADLALKLEEGTDTPNDYREVKRLELIYAIYEATLPALARSLEGAS